MEKGILKFLAETAVAAGKIHLKYFRKPHHVQTKKNAGIVTDADKASEAYILKKLSRNYKNSTIITEESGEFAGDRSLCWVIDPLDGTTNFAHGYPWFCVSIAAYSDGEPLAGAVYQPVSKELFLAERGKGTTLNGKRVHVSKTKKLEQGLLGTGLYYTCKGQALTKELKIFRRVSERVLGLRRAGAAALDLAYVACGRFDGYWQKGLSSWDVAAAYLLIEEAGGKVSGYRGQKTNIFAQEAVASNGKIHRSLVNLIDPK